MIDFQAVGLAVILVVSILGIIASLALMHAAQTIIQSVVGFLISMAFIVILYVTLSALLGLDWRVFW